MKAGDRAKQVRLNSCKLLEQPKGCSRLEIRLASQITSVKYDKASSNTPVKCLKLEIRKRSFLARRTIKDKLLILNENQK